MINYTITPLLNTQKKNKKGLCPVRICVSVEGKRTYFATGYKLQESEWNAEKKEIINRDNAKLLNVQLRKEIAEMEQKISLLQIEGRDVTVNSLRGKSSDRSFAHFAREVRYVPKEVNRVMAYAPGIMLSEMNAQFLRKYNTHELARGMSVNTTNTTFKYLRRIIRQAYAEKIISENPFDSFKVPKYVNPERVFLTLREVDLIEKWIKKDIAEHLYNTAVWFLFGCYTGLRVSDWQLFSLKNNVREGRVIIRAKKNKKDVTIKIYPRLAAVLNKLQAVPAPYSGNKLNFFLKDVGILAKVGKILTCHASRHTFGTLMATMGVSIETTSELMGIDVKTAKVYYQITGAKIDRETEQLKNM